MPNARRRAPAVPRRVKIAIQALFEQTVYDLAAAATAGGISTYRLREEPKKAHVLQYMRAEKKALIERATFTAIRRPRMVGARGRGG